MKFMAIYAQKNYEKDNRYFDTKKRATARMIKLKFYFSNTLCY